MKEKYRNLLTVFIIISITALVIYLLPLIPNYLRQPETDDIVGFQPKYKYILVFLIFNAISIGIPAFIHKIYVNDYGKIKNVWFFTFFGGITGAFFGEIALGASIFLIIPYTILMFIYSQFYKRYIWWKVALTTYLAGVLVENAMNRSPIQIPTLIWIGIFTYPYFWTKIWDNRKEFPIKNMLKDLVVPAIASIILTVAAYFLGAKTSGQISPPLIFLGASLPFIIFIPYKLFKRKKQIF